MKDIFNTLKNNVSYFFRLIKENYCYNGIGIDESILMKFNNTSNFKVMTFNIRRDAVGDGENNWIYRRDSIINMIIDNAPDVICFQEVMPNAAKYLIHKLSKYYDNYGIETFTNKDISKSNLIFGEGLFIMWRKDLFEVENKRISKLFDGRKINLRRFIEVRLKNIITGEYINVINTHLCHKSKTARDKSVELLYNYVKTLNNKFYLCGDFNTSKTLEDSKISLLLTDYSYNYGKSQNETTTNSFGKSISNHIIDYIFSNDELYIYKIITDSYGIKYLSDHYPVLNIYKCSSK
jgi:endonuclease/exonuclease/phosphatase family metal-dependent hydrolase